MARTISFLEPWGGSFVSQQVRLVLMRLQNSVESLDEPPVSEELLGVQDYLGVELH